LHSKVKNVALIRKIHWPTVWDIIKVNIGIKSCDCHSI
jgi:hypothetical protein